MIVDAHTHVFPAEFSARRDALCRDDEVFAELYGDPRAAMATPHALLASMDRAGIDTAVITGFAWRDPARCREHNDALLDAAAAAGGRLLPFIAVSLVAPDSAAAEVARCRARGARGVGELRPAAHGLDLATPRDADALAELLGGLPVLVHATEPVGHRYPGKGGGPIAALYQFIVRHPDVTLIAAHLGGGLPLYAHMPEVHQALRNVYIDTAAWPLLYRPSIFRHLIDVFGVEKILFATDYPLRGHRRELKLLAAALPDATERAAVLGGNAARLFALDMPPPPHLAPQAPSRGTLHPPPNPR